MQNAARAKEETEQVSIDELRRLTQIEALTHLEEYQYTDVSGVKINIPAKCAVSQVEGENTLADGLVIIDSDGNEWVWIKVPRTIYTDPNYITANSGNEVTDKNDVEGIYNILNEYAKVYRNGKLNQIINTKDEWFDSQGKNKEQSNNLNDVQGCGLTEKEYEDLYEKMLTSIYINGGFWIYRYEAGTIDNNPRLDNKQELVNPVSKGGMYPYNFITCYQAQQLASNVSVENKNISLMFGIQWDLVCKFLEESGVKSNLINEDSTTWGNYSNVQIKLKKGKYTVWNPSTFLMSDWYTIDNIYVKPSSGDDSNVLLTTGNSEVNKKMNIYDFAGNTWEWTLEYSNLVDTPTINRGGQFNAAGNSRPASTKSPHTSIGNGATGSFRFAMY